MEGFLGEIKMVAGNTAPRGWEFCDGKQLVIRQNSALFDLLGIKYGGDGVNTFCLPDLRGRMPVGAGSGVGLTSRNAGETGGKESVYLSEAEMPVHNHTYAVSSSPIATVPAPPRDAKPAGNFLGEMPGIFYYKNQGQDFAAMNPKTIGEAGEGHAHENMPPFVSINFIICVEGVYPG